MPLSKSSPNSAAQPAGDDHSLEHDIAVAAEVEQELSPALTWFCELLGVCGVSVDLDQIRKDISNRYGLADLCPERFGKQAPAVRQALVTYKCHHVLFPLVCFVLNGLVRAELASCGLTASPQQVESLGDEFLRCLKNLRPTLQLAKDPMREIVKPLLVALIAQLPRGNQA